MMKLAPIVTITFTLVLSGCAPEAPKPAPVPAPAPAAPAPEAAPVATPAAAPGGEAVEASRAPGVVPGSYEDWCEEHAVPESQCTRCNADLIPAFKATGDWCELHQLPKSQDLADNPDLKIVRPPKPAEPDAKS